jgi:hypothetical protein
MEGQITKIKAKDECIEIVIEIRYDNYQSTVPIPDHYIFPYMKQDGIICDYYKEEAVEAMKRYKIKYDEWERKEIKRLQYNDSISSLRLGTIDIMQESFHPYSLCKRPVDLESIDSQEII